MSGGCCIIVDISIQERLQGSPHSAAAVFAAPIVDNESANLRRALNERLQVVHTRLASVIDQFSCQAVISVKDAQQRHQSQYTVLEIRSILESCVF